MSRRHPSSAWPWIARGSNGLALALLALFVANVVSQNLRWGVDTPRGWIGLAFGLIGFTLVAAAPYTLALIAAATRGRTIAVVSIVTNAIYALGYLALGVYVL